MIISAKQTMQTVSEVGSLRSIRAKDWGILLTILLVSTVLRFYHLGQLSLWYDEVVTMRLARTPGPVALVGLLDQIDATRAPLHPLLLQAWLKFWGPSDVAGRALSACAGVLVVGLVFWVGRLAFDTRTGLWGAWLASWSPTLIQYSQETRMYEGLVLLTCLGWGLLLSFRDRSGRSILIAYSVVLAAMIYSHPLGLIMAATLAFAAALHKSRLGLTWKTWIATHTATALMVAPWISRYFDHPPEYVIGRLPLRYLFGLPIGFIGGNSLSLIPLAGIILWGLLARSRGESGARKTGVENPVESSCLIVWFLLPPLVLYLYSWLKHPIFGPSRYTIFVAPAYLLLVARGMSKLPLKLGIPLASVGVILSTSLLMTMVYDRSLKTDWRRVAMYLDQHAPGEPLVLCGVPAVNHPSFVAAQYYFGEDRRLIPMSTRAEDIPASAWHVIVPEPKRSDGPVSDTARCDEPEGQVVLIEGARLIRPR